VLVCGWLWRVQCTVMKDPVLLPSNDIMDRSVIMRHLLSDPVRIAPSRPYPFNPLLTVLSPSLRVLLPWLVGFRAVLFLACWLPSCFVSGSLASELFCLWLVGSLPFIPLLKCHYPGGTRLLVVG